jgi:hypothetical protein
VSRKTPILLLPLLVLLWSCGTDYPPIDPYFSFDIPQSVDFTISNTASLGIDTSLTATGSIDTNDYIKNGSSAYLLHTSEVWQLSLQSSDPSFTLDQLGDARVLIGTDTIAFDTLPPQATLDTTLILTKTDITPFMKDTSFTASLRCHLHSVPENPVIITCNMTVIYTSADQNF